MHLLDQGLQRLPDGEILSKARAENRIVLTIDLDLGYLLAISGAALPSVVIFRLGNASRKVVEARLSDVLSRCADDLKSGAIISVSDSMFRVRTLPM